MAEEFELETWDNGKPKAKSGPKELQERIARLKEKKDFRGIIELASTLQNDKDTYLLRANAYMGLQRW